MRLIVMFDLPSVTSKELKAANKWRKFLVKNGFIMMSESVYCRLAINRSIALSVKKNLKENIPPKGLVQVLEVTEKQYCSMEYLLGEAQLKVVETTERYIEI